MKPSQDDRPICTYCLDAGKGTKAIMSYTVPTAEFGTITVNLCRWHLQEGIEVFKDAYNTAIIPAKQIIGPGLLGPMGKPN